MLIPLSGLLFVRYFLTSLTIAPTASVSANNLLIKIIKTVSSDHINSNSILGVNSEAL